MEVSHFSLWWFKTDPKVVCCSEADPEVPVDQGVGLQIAIQPDFQGRE